MDRKIYNPTNIPLDNIDIDQQDRIRKSNTYNRKNIAYFDDELFLPYPDNPDYMIGNKGTVYNTKSGNLVKQYIGQKGYVRVGIPIEGKNHGKQSPQKVHRLVYGVFGEKPLNSSIQIDHIDADKANNRIENLEAVTCKENIHRAIEKGIRARYPFKPKTGLSDSFIERYTQAKMCNPSLSVDELSNKLNLSPLILDKVQELDSKININYNNTTTQNIDLNRTNSGQSNYNSRYTDEFVDQICQYLVQNPPIPCNQIAKLMNVPKEDYINIKRLCADIRGGRIWKHISSKYGFC